MIVAVVSDTHRKMTYIEKVKKVVQEADILIHLGDNTDDIELLEDGFKGRVYGVRGNCDISKKYPEEQVIDVEGKKIFFTHGHNYGVKSSYTSIYCKGMEIGADVVLFGHTHQTFMEEYRDIIFVNPGSVSMPNLRGRYVVFLDVQQGKKVQVNFKEII